MGLSSSAVKKSDTKYEGADSDLNMENHSSDIAQTEPYVNGFCFNGWYIPEEVLILLLSFVDHKSLLNFRRVCVAWRDLIDNNVFCEKFKEERHKYHSGYAVHASKKLPWDVYYSIFAKDPFGRNLIKNNCGQDRLQCWEILSSGGNRWVIENPPVGSDPLPGSDDFKNLTMCFATSYHSCTKQQIINLAAEGIKPLVMDHFQPIIVASDWYANRFDCACIYDIEVSLLNKDLQELHKFETRKRMAAGENVQWKQVRHQFTDYGGGVRYIRFYHGGMDSQYWAGHYGSKMSGASVKLYLLPEVP